MSPQLSHVVTSDGPQNHESNRDQLVEEMKREEGETKGIIGESDSRPEPSDE